ncbi:MAG: tetratricopeptide repeat protein [Planctomycetes bacterium]|nr:tetratricopeptide repeat protein [Planctomycetota bacterium]
MSLVCRIVAGVAVAFAWVALPGAGSSAAQEATAPAGTGDAAAAVAQPAEGPAAGEAPPEPVADAPAGQELLDDAIAAKLEINEMDDFARVLDLCKRAIDRGLDESSRKFAEDLYTGTLLDRAAMFSGAILETDDPDPQWKRIRAFALRDLQEVLDRDADIGAAHLLVARLESLPGGNRERAVESARRALERLGDDSLQRAQATLVLASVEDDADKRGELLDQAVELAPRDADVRKARGLHRLLREDYAAAREDIQAALAETPEDISTLEALGLAYMMEEKLDEAIATFDKAIELEPEAAGVILKRARAHVARGNRDQALADIGEVIELVPRELGPRLLRATILQQAERSAEAVADVEAVLEQEPDLPAALELRGLIASQQGDYPEAIRNFRKLVAKNPDNAAIVSQLGMLYLINKQPREAIRRFTKAIEIDPEEFSARRGRSDAAISIGDHPAAVVDLEKALALKPDDPGILNNFAWLLATSPDDGLRDAPRAIELAQRACEQTEWKEAHIISTLAAGYAEQGDFETARKFSQQAVDVDAGEGGSIQEQLKSELASYEAGKPWRERQDEGETGDGDVPAEPARAQPGPAGDQVAGDGPRAVSEAQATGDDQAAKAKPRRPFDD